MYSLLGVEEWLLSLKLAEDQNAEYGLPLGACILLAHPAQEWRTKAAQEVNQWWITGDQETLRRTLREVAKGARRDQIEIESWGKILLTGMLTSPIKEDRVAVLGALGSRRDEKSSDSEAQD